jgi:hypothetical protein
VLRLAMKEPQNRHVQLGANDEQKDRHASKNMQRKYLQATLGLMDPDVVLIPRVRISLFFSADSRNSFQNEFFLLKFIFLLLALFFLFFQGHTRIKHQF